MNGERHDPGISLWIILCPMFSASSHKKYYVN